MKVGSVSGFAVDVKDLDQTAKFYDGLGFRFGRREDDRLVVYVNWFSVEFIAGRKSDNVGEGVAFLISVSNVDEFYEESKKAGYKPETEPKDGPSKRREFSMLDPDGYKLVFFTKK